MPTSEIGEIRRIRHEISAQCDHDIHKLADYCRQVEQELRRSGEFRFENRDPERVEAKAGSTNSLGE